MASYDRVFSASPVLVVPSQPARQPLFGTSTFSHQTTSFSNFTAFGSNACLPQSYVSPSVPHRRGRKRSRDEASENLDDRVGTTAEKPQEPKETWSHTTGISLTRPGAYSVSNASAQPITLTAGSTAVEERRIVESATVASKHQQQDRPSLRSHKSQRLDIACSVSSPTSSAAHSSSPVSSTPLDSPGAPVIDDFTVAFGIGWRLMAADSTMSAAIRGWARYIENHYPLNNVKVHAESKSLESYLVQANEGWFLFDENLRQGRLVSTDNQRCIEHLKSSPPVFEGTEVMVASASCGTIVPQSQPIDMDTEMN